MSDAEIQAEAERLADEILCESDGELANVQRAACKIAAALRRQREAGRVDLVDLETEAAEREGYERGREDGARKEREKCNKEMALAVNREAQRCLEAGAREEREAACRAVCGPCAEGWEVRRGIEAGKPDLWYHPTESDRGAQICQAGAIRARGEKA